MIVKAILCKLQSDSTFFHVKSGFIGKEFWIEMDSLRQSAFYNKETKKYFMAEIVFAVYPQTGEKIEYLPTELLEMTEETYKEIDNA